MVTSFTMMVMIVVCDANNYKAIPGLWTMDWTVDWTMDWAFLIEKSCLTVSWFAAWPRIETGAHN